MTGRTLVIGLDGATFTVLDSLFERGVMPFLREFTTQGLRAPLRSVVPPLTPPAWASFMTGKRPGGHGVFDFFQKQSPESHLFRLTLSSDLRTPTLWELASAADRQVTVLNFPLTFPPPNLKGCIVPGGWMPWKQLRLGCHPPGLFDRLKALDSFQPRELALDMLMEEKALEGCKAEEYADWIQLHIRRERRWFDIADLLMREEPADLTAVMFDGVDKLQHLCWRFLDPALRSDQPTAWEEQVRGLCDSYFRQLDEILAAIVDRAGPDTTVVLASDHGFGASSDIFYVNAWLEQEGFLTWTDAADTQASERVGIGHLARHVFELDWTRTTAYSATPSSQGIHLVRRPDESPEPIREALIDAIRTIRQPDTGRPAVSELWTKEDAFKGPYQDDAPDLTLFLENLGVMSILRSPVIFRRRSEPVGTHHPVGILLARGHEVPLCKLDRELSIVDMTPILLNMLGIPVPADLDGRLPDELRAAAPSRPRSIVAPAPTPRRDHPACDPEAYDPDEEAVVLKRLQALGYLE